MLSSTNVIKGFEKIPLKYLVEQKTTQLVVLYDILNQKQKKKKRRKKVFNVLINEGQTSRTVDL